MQYHEEICFTLLIFTAKAKHVLTFTGLPV